MANGTTHRHKHSISILVENHPGVLVRVAALFARRGYNIESVSVGATQDPMLSRITIVVTGNDAVIEQVTKQLHKLIEVIKVSDITHTDTVDRELVLIKVSAKAGDRHEILAIADTFRANVIDVAETSLVVEATGQPDKLTALENLLRRYGIIETVRTGKVVLVRGAQNT